MGYCFLNCKQNVNKYKNFVELSDPNLICGHSFAIKTRILLVANLGVMVAVIPVSVKVEDVVLT
jgi:hypothetical protein